MAKTTKQTTKKAVPHCPFCDVEIMELNLPICQACHAVIAYCAECKQPLPKNARTCPGCGAKVKK